MDSKITIPFPMGFTRKSKQTTKKSLLKAKWSRYRSILGSTATAADLAKLIKREKQQ